MGLGCYRETGVYGTMAGAVSESWLSETSVVRDLRLTQWSDCILQLSASPCAIAGFEVGSMHQNKTVLK